MSDRRHIEALGLIQASIDDYERLANRREKAGYDSSDPLLVGLRQVEVELRDSHRVLTNHFLADRKVAEQ